MILICYSYTTQTNMRSASVLLLALVTAVTTVSVGWTDDLLYPWGEEEGDRAGPQYAGVFPITMTTRIRYFKQYYWNISLCVGGRIGFEPYGFRCGEGIEYPPSSPNIIPFGINQNLASTESAPKAVYFDYYYDSNDFAIVETLWYRTTKDPSLLQKARDDVRQNFNTCHMNFVPKELFIVTWTDIHDIDFCEANGWEEPVCYCIIHDSPFNKFMYMMYGTNEEANYVYCNCMVNGFKHDAACICFVMRTVRQYYLKTTVGVNFTICLCLDMNNFDMEFCRCEVLGECSDTRRGVNPVMRHRREQHETNTYQAVLMTDGYHSYVMFNYFDINWVYMNTFNDGFTSIYYHRPQRIFAKVGFDKGNDLKYSHEYSGSEELYKLATDSNVRVPGRWMYKVSGRKIVGPDCKKIPFDP